MSKMFTVVEMDIDYCKLTYGSSPCTASLGAGTPAKCFNTRKTCQDPDNYDPEPKTLRFCQPTDDLPVGMDAIPSVVSVDTAPSKIRPGEDLGERASVSVTFRDHTYHDRGIDKYAAGRVDGTALYSGTGYDPAKSGTYWGKWRARNPYFQNRSLRIFQGTDVEAINNYTAKDVFPRELIYPLADNIVYASNLDKLFFTRPSIPKTYYDIDPSTVSVNVHTFPGGITYWQNIAYEPTQKNLYMGAGPVGTHIEVRDAVTGAQVSSMGSGMTSAEADPAHGVMYVVDYNNHPTSVYIFDASTFLLVQTVAVGSTPAGMALDSANGKMYVCNFNSDNVSIIDTTTYAVTTVTVGNQPTGIAYDSDKGEMYVCNYGGDTVSVIDCSTQLVTHTISTNLGPNQATYDSTHGQVYVSCYQYGSVDNIDTDTKTIRQSVGLGHGVIEVKYDPVRSRIYVASIDYIHVRQVLADGLIEQIGSITDGFSVRHYVMESVAGPTRDGTFTVTAKDVLKLADDDRAQAPVASSGTLQSNITNTATSATLSPSGVGDLEYPGGGFITIGNEVMSFIRSGDSLTLTRAQYNTAADSHESGDTVQIAIEYDSIRASDIVYDLLTNYAGVNPGFIRLSDWLVEDDAYINRLYNTLVTEPTSVRELIGQLCKQAGFSVWWDEEAQLIRFSALKPVPSQPLILDDNKNFIQGSVSVKDQLKKRRSQVWVYYGVIDPTEDMDDARNYRSVHVEIDADAQSQDEYQSSQIEKVYGRWIDRFNSASAVDVSKRILSRFRDPPRKLMMKLKWDDRSTSLGNVYAVQTALMQQPDGSEGTYPFIVLSHERGAEYVNIEAEEYTYDSTLVQGAHIVTIDANTVSMSDGSPFNLRTAHDNLYPTLQSGDTVRLVITSGTVLGSKNTSSLALETGNWPTGITVEIENNGVITGAGGAGGAGSNVGTPLNGTPGGDAVNITAPTGTTTITFTKTGSIWGGGGGGGGGDGNEYVFEINVGGGGGGGGSGCNSVLAGIVGGQGGIGGSTEEGGRDGAPGANGQLAAGGSGGLAGRYSNQDAGNGGDGGGPGQAGSNGTNGDFSGTPGSGAAAGKAITGYANATYQGTIDIRGATS